MQIVIAAMIPPRERGRYNGYLGAVMAVAIVAGPLLGGLIVDTSWLGWRWCFFIAVPIAVVAFVVLQKTLHVADRQAAGEDRLPGRHADRGRGQHPADLGVLRGQLVRLAVLADRGHGRRRAWRCSPPRWFVEGRAAEPVVPLPIVKRRTTALAIVASLAVGMAMFGGAVFLGQYFQVGRGYSPTRGGPADHPDDGSACSSRRRSPAG